MLWYWHSLGCYLLSGNCLTGTQWPSQRRVGRIHVDVITNTSRCRIASGVHGIEFMSGKSLHYLPISRYGVIKLILKRVLGKFWLSNLVHFYACNLNFGLWPCKFNQLWVYRGSIHFGMISTAGLDVIVWKPSVVWHLAWEMITQCPRTYIKQRRIFCVTKIAKLYTYIALIYILYFPWATFSM